MTALLTQTEFGKLCGITPQAVHSAIKRERVVTFEKRIDPGHPTNEYFRNQSRNRRQRAKDGPPTDRKKVGPKQPGDAAGDAEPQNGLTDHLRRQLGLDEIDKSESGLKYKNEVDLAKVLEQVKGLQLKNDETRNKLISRDMVKQVLGEIYTVETSELLSLGEKLGPEIASLFGVDDQTAILDAGKMIQLEVSKSLEHIELTINKFLKLFQIEGN